MNALDSTLLTLMVEEARALWHGCHGGQRYCALRVAERYGLDPYQHAVLFRRAFG